MKIKNKTILISLVFAVLTIFLSINSISAATLYWVGTNNELWGNASSWASSSGGAGGAGIPGASDDVVFDSANLNNAVINETGFTGVVNSINISVKYSGTIADKMNWNNSLNVTGNVIISNGTLNHGDNSNLEQWRVNLKIGGNLTIESGGSINVNGLGFDAGQGFGRGSGSYGGGGYGGMGGGQSLSESGMPYGSITSPINLGSGGTGSSGGGAVILNVSGTTVINGNITVAGSTSTGYDGAGSGGGEFT